LFYEGERGMIKKLFMLSLFFCAHGLVAMEERQVLPIKELPSELQVYLTQFLGSSLAETLKNIASLSLVDKYFNSLIAEHRNYVAKMLKNRFPGQGIPIVQNAAEKNNFIPIHKLLEMGLVNISDVLDIVVDQRALALIDNLYEKGFLRNEPFIRRWDDVLVTPLDYVMSKDYVPSQGIEQPNSPRPIIIKIIENGGDVNQLVGLMQETPLHVAMMMLDWRLFEALLNLGANPNIPNADGKSVMQDIHDSRIPQITRFRYISDLEKRGFQVACNRNLRGKRLLAQRKKVRTRSNVIARNTRKSGVRKIA
jgi:hypothetical protein